MEDFRPSRIGLVKSPILASATPMVRASEHFWPFAEVALPLNPRMLRVSF